MHKIALRAGKVEQGREKIRPEIKRTQLKNTLTAKKNLTQGGAHCFCNMHTKEKMSATHCTSIEGAVLDKQLQVKIKINLIQFFYGHFRTLAKWVQPQKLP